jgi:hypothetical protein
MPTLKNYIAVLLFTLLSSQATETFKVRLSAVPINAAMRATVAGKGSAIATLTGKKLSISGSFEGLRSAATIAQLRQGKVTGVSGPFVADLTISNETSGTIQGSIELSPEQIDNLRKGLIYIQIHSEKAPDGNLWGWLLR